jgi:hypothetical protein
MAVTFDDLFLTNDATGMYSVCISFTAPLTETQAVELQGLGVVSAFAGNSTARLNTGRSLLETVFEIDYVKGIADLRIPQR